MTPTATCTRCGRPTPEKLSALRCDGIPAALLCRDCQVSLEDWLRWPKAELELAEHGAIEGATLTATTEHASIWQ